MFSLIVENSDLSNTFATQKSAMNLTITFKVRILMVMLTTILFSCTSPSPPIGQWFASVPYQNITYKMVLENNRLNSRLVNVTFKGYDVPLDTILFNDDSVYLQFGEFYTAFGGRYDVTNNTIKGTWFKEDSTRIAVTFYPANADTILGMHPKIAKEYVYTPPASENDGWQVSTLKEQNVNQSLTDSLIYAIMRKKYPDVHSLLIARNNHLVLEEYFYTFHSGFRQNIQSVTKSFVSTLAGIALEKGEIKDLNDPICNYLPEYRELACSEQNKTISLRNVLSMSTGLKWDEATYDYGDPKNSASIAAETGDPFKYLFGQPRSHTPIFTYNSLNHSMMNKVLRHVTHQDNASEITSRLLSKLQIDSYFLGNEDHGVLGDIELRPRDMMKLGQLYLQGGKWNGKQIITERWIRESTAPTIVVSPDFGYGYFWWTGKSEYKDATVPFYFAWGYGGQYIFVVPDLELVVALTGSHWTTDPKNHVMEMLQRYIIPACN
jgi:CubicO group peptidase (beta-lactamase class C family)